MAPNRFTNNTGTLFEPKFLMKLLNDRKFTFVVNRRRSTQNRAGQHHSVRGDSAGGGPRAEERPRVR